MRDKGNEIEGTLHILHTHIYTNRVGVKSTQAIHFDI